MKRPGSKDASGGPHAGKEAADLIAELLRAPEDAVGRMEHLIRGATGRLRAAGHLADHAGNLPGPGGGIAGILRDLRHGNARCSTAVAIARAI